MLGIPNALIVHEPTPDGESILVWANTSNLWSIGKYAKRSTVLMPAGSTVNTIVSPNFTGLDTVVPGTYLIQDSSGNIRSIGTISGTTATLTQNVTPYPIGAVVDLYECNTVTFKPPNFTKTQYDALVPRINQVWATPTGTTLLNSYGWNQTPLVPSSNPPSTPEMNRLLDVVSRCCNLLDIPNSLNMATFIPSWSGTFLQSLEQYMNMTNQVNQISWNRFKIPFKNTENSPLATRTHVGTWQNINLDYALDFASASAMAAFFNSGGWLGFDMRIQDDNYVQTAQKFVFSEIDKIKMSALLTESTGARKIGSDLGNAVTTSTGSTGYFSLNAVTRTVFSHTFFLSLLSKTLGGVDYITVSMDATKPTATQIILSLKVQDLSGALYSLTSNGGPASITAQLFGGRADSAILIDNVSPYPVPTLLGTTSW
jgi:hypothetical protein